MTEVERQHIRHCITDLDRALEARDQLTDREVEELESEREELLKELRGD